MKTEKYSFALAATESDGVVSESRFQQLWKEAERLKRDNADLEVKLDLLVQRIRNSIGPVEMEMGRAMRVQIDKLISFGGRKSMPKWQLHVLDDWVMSSMDCLQSAGLVDDALTESFATLQAQTLGFDIDYSCGLSASDQLAAYMESQVDNIDMPLDVPLNTDSASGEFDEAQEWADAESNLTFNMDQTDTSEPQAVFKTLFHRIARALHPDKETDPAQRQYKQALMAQLLEARRQKDVMSMFQMYQEHVDDSNAFDMNELAELENLLCQFIQVESHRHEQITTKTHLHDIAYTQYYSDDPNKVNRAIAQKIWDIKKRKNEIEAFSEAVTSVKKLGPYLEDRLEQLRQYS